MSRKRSTRKAVNKKKKSTVATWKKLLFAAITLVGFFTICEIVL